MKKILSLVLAAAIVFSSLTLFQTAPKVEAATYATAMVGGAGVSDPLKMTVYNDGSLALYFWTGSVYQYEYYSQTSWGTNLFFTNDTTGTAYHYSSPYYAGYPGYGSSLGYGDLTQSGNTVTCTWLLDGGAMKFEQIVQYTSGNYVVDITFRLTNLSSNVTYSNAKVIHGGDTYFGGADSATSYYNSSNGMVYVRNADMTRYGIMGFAGYTSSPASAYFAGNYGTGNQQAVSGQLSNSISTIFEDAGYQLQWNQGSLAPSQSWEIKSYTMVTEPGAIQVISPSQQSAVQGTAVDYTFYVQNFSTDAQSIAMAASSEHGWPTTLVSATPVTVAGSGGSTAVTVRVQVPANAGGVSSDIVTLTATGAKAASGSATTNVMYSPTINVSASPNPVTVGTAVTLTASIAGGGSPTGTATFFNNGTSIGSAAVSNGTASLSYTPASAGNLSITASYSGDAHNTSAVSSAATLAVLQKQPVLTLSASPDSPGTYPADITYTAALSNYYGSLSGKTVVITVAGTPYSVTTDASGAASYTFTPPEAGTSYTASAIFAGDANHLAASSSTVNYVYSKGTQTTPGISLQNGNAAITYGDSLSNYKAVGSGGESTGAYEYRSDNTSVLSVDSVTGQISVNGAGNAKIYVKRLGDTNYNASAESFVQITVAAKPITVINVGVMNKIYDGTTDASFSGTPVLSGVVSGDVVTLTNGTPTFAGKNYSSSPVTVNFTTAFSISGTEAGNYILTQPSSVTASIGKRPLTVSVNPVLIACGQALPVLGVTVNTAGFVSGETEGSLAGFAKPQASHTYGSTTELANNKDFSVTYSGGNATDNYYFIFYSIAKITIHPVYIADGDYQVTGSYGVSASPAGWNKENIVITPANGYDKISLTGDVWTDSITVSEEALNGQAAFKLKKSSDGTQTEFSSIYYNLDKVAPTGEITVKENKFTAFMNGITFGLFYKETLDVTITGADTAGNAGSGVSTIEYQKVAAEKAGALDGIWTTYAPLSVSPDDTFIIYAKITDKAGNVTIINSNGIVTDTTEPVIQTVYANDNIWTKETDGKIVVTATDNLSGIADVTYSIDGGAAIAASSNFEITDLADGDYIVVITATDYSGNSKTASVAVKKDTAAPVINMTYVYDNVWTTDEEARIPVSVSDSLSGVFSITGVVDGDSLTIPYNPYTFVHFPDGHYEIVITAADNVGNISTKTVTVKKDTTEPTLSVTGDTASYLPADTLTITTTAGASGIARMEVQKPDGEIVDITSTYETDGFEVTANGSYYFWMTNGAGERAATFIRYTRIDAVQPVVSIDSNGYTEGAWTNIPSVTLDVTNTADPANLGTTTYEVSTDGTNFEAFDGTYVISSDSSETYSFRARSASGVLSDVKTFEVKMDQTLPTGKITIETNEFMSFLNTITFNLFFKETTAVTVEGFDAANQTVNSGVASVEYQKAAAEKADPLSGTWTANAPLNVSPDEKFIIYAKITDNAGNVIVINSSGAIVDATKPVITMDYPADGVWTTDPDAQISVEVTDALADVDTVTYSIDGAAEVTGSPSFVIDGLSDGTYDIVVTATDKSGNVQTASVTIWKDTTAPTITAVGDTGSYLQGDMIDVAAAAGVSGIDCVTVEKPDGEIFDITSTYAADGYEVLANGSYTFTVTNRAGVSATAEITYNRIDRVQPAVSIDSNGYTEGAWTNIPYVTLDVTNTADPANLGTTIFEVSTDGIIFEEFAGAFVISSDSSETYSFRARSASGVVSDVKTFEVKMDHTLPAGKITIETNEFMSFLNTITFNLFFKETTAVTIEGFDTADQTVNSGVAAVEYQKVAAEKADPLEGTWTTYAPLNVSPDEKFIIYARITDNAGNVTIINTDGMVVYTNSALSRTSVMFDVDESRSAYADIGVTLTPAANTIKQIALGENILVRDTDYTVDGSVVTIKKEYLKTVVSGTISLTFTFNPLGENYGQGDAPATAQLAVTQIIHTQVPDFSTNLSGTKTYGKNDISNALQVLAEVNDGGNITYQWYVSSTAQGAGTAIDGATKSSYTPKTDVTGAFYYSVVAVNTNEGVSGDRVAEAVSGTCKVVVNNSELLPPEIGKGAPAATLPGEAKAIIESVLTQTDDQKLAQGSDISICLRVTKADVSQADRDAAAQALGNNVLAEFLDISLVKTIDGIETKVTQTDSPILITLQIPEDMRKEGRVFAIIRIHNGTAKTLADLDTDPATFTFETDCFSTYAPVYKDAAVAGAAKTGEESPAVPYYIIGAGLLLTAFYLGKKRRDRMEADMADDSYPLT